jgi:hypothetical protein
MLLQEQGCSSIRLSSASGIAIGFSARKLDGDTMSGVRSSVQSACALRKWLIDILLQ